MSDYFEEMGWRPLAEGEQPDHLLHFARLLLDFGIFDDNMTGQWPSLPPPAAKEAVKNLKTRSIEEVGKQCPVCLKNYKLRESATEMPCHHEFHTSCISPWLVKTNSCPLCRFELPTDDETYEAFKKEKIRSEQRKIEIEELHNSMFS